MILVQNAIDAISLGAIYALAALGSGSSSASCG
jgi:hypothetical protein